jgi:hypothetical protein
MPMPVTIGAFSKNFEIFFTAPVWIVKLMRGIKMQFARYINQALRVVRHQFAKINANYAA